MLLKMINYYDEILLMLEQLAKESRTTKLWIDCLIKPVFLMKLFVNSEREVDWALHLYSERLMMPYFYSARQNNNAQYGLYYLRLMERLPKNDFTKFKL